MKYVRIFFLLLITSSAFADPFNGILNLSAGTTWGTANEYVFHKGKELSLIEWQENWVPQIGISGGILGNGLYSDIGSKFTYPLKSGSVIDTDHDLVLKEDGRDNIITRFSEHDAKVDNDIIIKFTIGYSIKVHDLSITPSIGLQIRNKKQIAYNGYRMGNDRTPLSTNTEKVSLLGTVLTYEQSIISTTVGLALDYQPGANMSILVSGSVYPYSWVKTLDNHILTRYRFIDVMNGGIGGDVNFGLTYYPKLEAIQSFHIKGGWESLSMPLGLDYYGKIGDNGIMELYEDYNSKMTYSFWNAEAGMSLLCW
jgi:hypothetical protein